MQYARRDDSNGSTPYQHHQNLSQALTVNHLQNAPQHPSHSPLFSVGTGHTSPVMKRKQTDPIINSQLVKRRRDDDNDSFDIDPNNQGAKHWTDDEKTRLFKWLMGPGQDEHWNALRATKNSCLRECAVQVFDSKKTYQALKGCYERNFTLFKQIYAFEVFCAQSQMGPIPVNEADRLREYERRLQNARKSECDIGNLNARTIDHWHRMGWYNLFCHRWQGEVTTSTRPPQGSRPPTTNGSNPHPGDDTDIEDNPHVTFSEPMIMPNGMNPTANNIPTDRNNHPLTYINPQSLREPVMPPSAIPPLGSSAQQQQQQQQQSRTGSAVGPPPPVAPTATPVQPVQAPAPAPVAVPSSSTLDQQQPMLSMVIPQAMLQAYLQYLQVQTQTSKMKLEYMRRREEREELESQQRREAERLRMEREAEEFEQIKHKEKIQQKTERALELLQSQIVDESVKQVAGDFLKTLFTAD